ncbi:hypothetical protein OR263_34665 [Streptomyces sp. NEAU-H22]|nr:hypothetical protein [Streptomyces sp. NEAU-H22]
MDLVVGGIADDSTSRLTAVHGVICRSVVGAPDVQVLNGTARPVHGADVAVIVISGIEDQLEEARRINDEYRRAAESANPPTAA